VLCVSKADLARMLAGPDVDPDNWTNNLSRYESLSPRSHRNLDRQVIRQIDDCVGAGGALEDLARSIDTPKIFSKSRSWAHNFQGPSGPIWIWIRFPDSTDRCEAKLQCGNISALVEIPKGEYAIFVTSEYSAPNPPVLAELSEPGWVNFGRGAIPPVLGVTVVSGFEILKKTPRLRKFMEVIRKTSLSDGELGENAMAFLGVAREPDLPPLDSKYEGVTTESDDEWSTSTRVSEEDRSDFRILRTSELFSVEEVASLATGMDPSRPLSDTTLLRFEHGLRVREWRSIQQRLDVIYRADGRAAQVEIERLSGNGYPSFLFPNYWIGPVWVSFAIPQGSKGGVVQLKWGGWQRKLTVSDDVVVSFRKSQDGDENISLEVLSPPEWDVRCGTGRVDGSVDINDGWVSIKRTFLIQKFNEIKVAMGQSSER